MVEKTIKKIDELLNDQDLKKKGQENIKRLLNDKIEMNEWFVDYLEKEIGK